MASLLDKKVVKNDKFYIAFIIVVLIFNIWYFSSPAKRMTEIAMFCNTIRYKYAKMTSDNSLEEYMYHRNNAVYLVKLGNERRTIHAIKEMDKAIATVPKYVSSNILSNLYKDRAYIKLYAGDKRGALDDLLRSSELNMNDNLIAAALLTDKQVYGIAKKHCQNIIKENDMAISGYICLAHVYERSGRLNSALLIYDYAIEKKRPNNSNLYLERALLKKRSNNIRGYEEDVAKAKTMMPKIKSEHSMMEDVINPKELNLRIL